MASNINPNNIDGTYPIAGQDNDSQGFRTNFTNIKNNFIYSKAELEDLQAKAVLKSALSGTTVDNNMAGTIFRAAEVRDLRETRVDRGTASGTITLDHTLGHYYTLATSGSFSIAFTGFPASGKVGRIKFEVSITNVAHTMTIPASVTYGTEGLAGFNDSTNTITFSDIGTYIFEFITENGGTDVHIADFSRARNYVHSSIFTLQPRTISNAIGSPGDLAGSIAVSNGYIYVCTADYNGSTAIWKRAALLNF